MTRSIHFKLKDPFISVCFFAVLLSFSNAVKGTIYSSFKDSFSFEEEFYSPIFSTEKLITCYPNPAVSHISFKFDNNVQNTSKLSIYSFTGKKMNEFNITNNLIMITLENYFRGLYVYLLKDTAGNILESGKFQVKN
ncbi:T9SS type A sorting domain-containing protein [Arachidicoccus soli]|uniref:T9SS C-terminal target domain-containing protein n=1 Tax=Arachidicoccus soli TaxID=2341117 RepID=A0A386HSI7_9BACT|nr:T9SS type A sorting domain-containing protein [Arachidicoccus soli]AYD48629.1 T9SS C-terminal target domain-containing protein [Arachidicoccus soli]